MIKLTLFVTQPFIFFFHRHLHNPFSLQPLQYETVPTHLPLSRMMKRRTISIYAFSLNLKCSYKSGRVVILDSFCISKRLQDWICLQQLLLQLALQKHQTCVLI